VIFTAPPVQDFAAVETALTAAFQRSQEAARNQEPIVYVLRQRDLLGQDRVKRLAQGDPANGIVRS